MTYSQYNDEEIINGVFGDYAGRFLDIGAFDGENMSNTRALALKGWSGLLVEPSPWVFPKLYELYKHNPKIRVMNAAASGRPGMRLFWADTTDHQYGSTLNEAWAKTSHINGPKPYWVLPVEIQELLAMAAFDFVSIDTEGQDIEILLAPTESQWLSVRLICFEHSTNPPNLNEALEAMNKIGFTEHAKTPTNTYLLRTAKA